MASGRTTERRRRSDSPRRAGQQDGHGQPSRLRNREETAGRAHHEHILWQTDLPTGVDEPPEVAGALRPEVGIEHRGCRSLELAELGSHVARERRGDAGVGTANGGSHLVLAIGVGVPVQQRDRNGFGARKRGGRAPVGVAVGSVAAQRAGNQRLRSVGEGVVQRGTILPSDLDDVCEPGAGDEGGDRPTPLEQRVGGDGGAVEESCGRWLAACPGHHTDALIRRG